MIFWEWLCGSWIISVPIVIVKLKNFSLKSKVFSGQLILGFKVSKLWLYTCVVKSLPFNDWANIISDGIWTKFVPARLCLSRYLGRWNYVPPLIDFPYSSLAVLSLVLSGIYLVCLFYLYSLSDPTDPSGISIVYLLCLPYIFSLPEVDLV